MQEHHGFNPAQVMLLTYGTRGDVEPFVALAAGLQRAGLSAKLAAPGCFRTLADEYRIPFVPLPGDPADLSRALTSRVERSWLSAVSAVAAYVAPIAEEVYATVRDVSRGADLIVHSFLMTLAGHEIALSLGIPDVSAQFFPVFAATSSFPAIVFPDWRLGSGYRRLSHWIVTQTYWQGSRAIYGRLRRRRSDLPDLSGWPFASARLRPPILFAFSRHVLPAPQDWDGVAEVTGYWALAAAPGWCPPPDVARFIEAGAPPVFIGFGSTVTHDPGELVALAVESLRRTGHRGIVDLGPEANPPGALSDTVLAVHGVPHTWLFPRMAVIVHHGGAGTTGAGLRAGVPNVLVPFASDQPFWGKRVAALGAGPPPIPARRLSVENLALAIRTASEDQAMRERAAHLGEKIRAEDGIAAAVTRLQQILAAAR